MEKIQKDTAGCKESKQRLQPDNKRQKHPETPSNEQTYSNAFSVKEALQTSQLVSGREMHGF